MSEEAPLEMMGVAKITLTNGTELTLKQARQLYNSLDQLFGNQNIFNTSPNFPNYSSPLIRDVATTVSTSDAINKLVRL